MPTRTALIPADVPTSLVSVFALTELQRYILQNISGDGPVLKFADLEVAPASTDRVHLLGSFEIIGFSFFRPNKIWVWGDGRGVWIAVTEEG